MSQTTDRIGNKVCAGDTVRVLSVSPSLISKIPEEDIERISSMVNMTLQVYEVDQYGQAWVEASWQHEAKTLRTHSLGLEPHEMELVNLE